MIVNASGDECARLRRMPELMRNGYDLIQLDQYEQPFVELHAEAIKAFDGPVVLDGGAWKPWSPDYLRLADTVVVSEAFHAGGPDGLGALCAGLGIVRWAMTRGAKGVHWYDRGRSGEIPAVKVNAIDTLGAGDIFHGAFCYFFARRGDFVGALTDASRIAAKSCTTAGTRRWMRA
jgi:sugar/nucleoside kinase (ribokinase family)